VAGMRKNIIVLFVLVITYSIFGMVPKAIGQQNVQYTQYMYDGSLINPAFTGGFEALNITLLHRDQWTGVPGAPESQTLSAHTLFRTKQLGTGLIFHREKVGIHQNVQAGVNLAYHLAVGEEKFLSFGLNASVFNTQSDYQSLQSSGVDPTASNAAFNGTQFNTGFGFYYRSKKLDLGYSVPSILSKEVYINDSTSLYSTKANHLLFAKYSLPVGAKLDFTPSILIKYYPDIPVSYDVNALLTYDEVISGGIAYRANESIDFLIRLQVTSQFQIGYSYDYPIANVGNFARASNELMLSYLFKFNYDKVRAPR
jgi:type IX secretion system PorP/SprF family membrane protein